MEIKYRLYPHPVLSSETDDYLNSEFTFDAKVEKKIKELKFSFVVSIKNDEINQMISEGYADILIHIECPLTCYRQIIKTSEYMFCKYIDEKEINGKVTLCAFVVAKKDIEKYHNSDFNKDYDGISFFVEKGSILAIGGQYTLDIIKEVDELTKIPSIFSICQYASDEGESMNIQMDGEKIVIGLSANTFQNYKISTSMPPTMHPIFHSIIIVPCLIYVFETLRREGIEEYEDLRWYKAIKKTLSKYEVNLNKELLSEIPSYELAQKLLEYPIDKAFSEIANIGDSEEEE